MNSLKERIKIDNPYIIAEIGVNHEGKMDLAKKMIVLAKEGGAHAVKFQSYKAGTLASKKSPAYWDTDKEPTDSQYTLFRKYDRFEKDDYIELALYCKSNSIDFLSTPFDVQAVDFLADYMPYYKIASADITNKPLLKLIAKKNKPVILSTGASYLSEIEEALRILKEAGCPEIALLHCVLNYPTGYSNAHLNMIESLRRSYPETIIGYSDHTVPDEHMIVLTAAWLKGAVILEKHFTFDKTLPGNDHYHAMDKSDLMKLCSNIRLVRDISGDAIKKPLKEENPARLHARRSIVTARNLKKGETIDESMITFKRPAHGISPMFWDSVLGKKVSHDIDEDEPLQWQMIE